MALFNLFNKSLKGENQYFQQRKVDSAPEVKKETPYLISDQKLTKDLLANCLKIMRNHDVKATVAVMANTTDTMTHQAGIMINKGYIPKKIVSYLQNITIREIESAIKLVKTELPDEDGFYPIDERTASMLNLPLGCMLCGIIHHLKSEFGIILVLKTNLKEKDEFLKKIKKLIV
ncbi:hypothetical protein KJ966_06175 [bacterium]|nr:hypothetical protein [bacterium]